MGYLIGVECTAGITPGGGRNWPFAGVIPAILKKKFSHNYAKFTCSKLVVEYVYDEIHDTIYNGRKKFLLNRLCKEKTRKNNRGPEFPRFPL
jgi:hypothetical protein